MLSVKPVAADGASGSGCVGGAQQLFSKWKVVEIALPPVSLPALFAALPIFPKWYWRSPVTAQEFVAAGQLWRLPEAVVAAAGDPGLRAYPPLPIVGGMAFSDHDGEPFPWQAFGKSWWWVPQFFCQRTATGTRLRFAFVRRNNAAAYEQLLRFFNAWQFLPQREAMPKARVLFHRPEKPAWISKVLAVRRAIAQGVIEKVVLSRLTVARFTKPPLLSTLLAQLNRRFPTAVVFCFQPSRHYAFCGATPEHLFHREGKKVKTRAIAGTQWRSGDWTQDKALQQALLSSRKNRQEHHYVVAAIAHALGPYSQKLDIGATTVLTLPHLYHLQTPIVAELHSPVSDFALIRALHPTPAVGGLPRAEAQKWIAQLEDHTRGWYAAPIGWITRDRSEIVVAIRSFLLTDSLVLFYTGAGLVLSSDPVQEWQELENKLATFAEWLEGATVGEVW